MSNETQPQSKPDIRAITVQVNAYTADGGVVVKDVLIPAKSWDLILSAAVVGLEGFEDDDNTYTEEELDATWATITALSPWNA